MPHALTTRQREYLEFLREYIKENEYTPRLEEIAEHFGVKSPTAHKTLEALHNKEYIYAVRSSADGFFIRLIERGGDAEIMIDVVITGKVNRYGELIEFPGDHGHYPAVFKGVKPDEIGALMAAEDIPEVNILRGDLLFWDMGKRPQPGDIAVLPFSRTLERFLLCRIYSLTSDKDLETLESANQYPIPEDLLDLSFGQRFIWTPLAYCEETREYFEGEAEKEDWPERAIPPELAMGTILRLNRFFPV